MQMRYRILTVCAAVAACGGSKQPAVAANPARGLVDLRDADSLVVGIAMEASRTLPTGLTPQPAFGGVYVNGRINRRASEAVAHAAGYASVTATKVGTPQCKARNMTTGQEMPIACPPQAVAAMPPLYVFDEVVATADSAYVGYTERSLKTDKATCLKLLRIGPSAWRVMDRATIADARRCGK
jgi:hypothetical protein